MEKVSLYQIAFYVPTSHTETVKQALFAAGAGQLGHYEHVSWQCLGQGQFKPLQDANPTIGTIDEVSYVDEHKVEMLCEEKYLRNAIIALKNSHPYEEPAYQIMSLVNEY